jgi:hypothetical protein
MADFQGEEKKKKKGRGFKCRRAGDTCNFF